MKAKEVASKATEMAKGAMWNVTDWFQEKAIDLSQGRAVRFERKADMAELKALTVNIKDDLHTLKTNLRMHNAWYHVPKAGEIKERAATAIDKARETQLVSDSQSFSLLIAGLMLELAILVAIAFRLTWNIDMSFGMDLFVTMGIPALCTFGTEIGVLLTVWTDVECWLENRKQRRLVSKIERYRDEFLKLMAAYEGKSIERNKIVITMRPGDSVSIAIDDGSMTVAHGDADESMDSESVETAKSDFTDEPDTEFIIDEQ